MANADDSQEERARVFQRAWRARWQRLRAGTPPPLVLDETNYVRKLFWTKHLETGFPHRVNHATASHRDKHGDWYVFSFGGYHADDDERTVRQADSQGGPTFSSAPIDVHRCDCESRAWLCMKPPLEIQYFNTDPNVRCKIPRRRYGHTVCSYAGRVYMYGGRNDEDGSFSSVDCYDIANNIWLKIRQDGERPMSRDGHACTSVSSDMFIHGGFSANELQFSPDTYVFNMSSHVWRKLKVKGHDVPARDFHTATAVADGSKIVMFGGRSDKFHPYFTANDEYYNDFYCLDLTSNEWSCKKVTGYEARGRRSHCAVAVGSTVLYFGGYNAVHKQHFGDLFLLNTDTWHVSELRPFGDGPPPRRRVGCVLIGNEVLICGGTSPVVVEKDGKSLEILHDHNDVYVLSLLPSLEELCLATIVKEEVAQETLPLHMRRIIEKVSMNHMDTITAPSVDIS